MRLWKRRSELDFVIFSIFPIDKKIFDYQKKLAQLFFEPKIFKQPDFLAKYYKFNTILFCIKQYFQFL